MKQLLCAWSNHGIRYRIHRTGLQGLLLSARGPQANFRATYLDLAEEFAPTLRNHPRCGAIDTPYRATTGWRAVSDEERTQLAETVLTQSAGSLDPPSLTS